MAASIAEGWRPGALGRIVELHGSYPHRKAGFGPHFEAKGAREQGFVLVEQRRAARWGARSTTKAASSNPDRFWPDA